MSYAMAGYVGILLILVASIPGIFAFRFHSTPGRRSTVTLVALRAASTETSASVTTQKSEVKSESSEIDSCELASEGLLINDCDDGALSVKREYKKIKPSVWSVFGDLAAETGGSNLGQGFPDWDPPKFMLDALRDAIDTPYHQYTRPAGHPPLVKNLAERYGQHMDRKIDPFREVTITVGASQALFLSLQTLLEPGDEVAMFDPYFDLYSKQLKAVAPQCVPKFITLGSTGGEKGTENPRVNEKDAWALDVASLEEAITGKTRVLLLNSPHNPTGKVFSLEELEIIAEVVKKHPNLVVVSDEVYKYSVYDALEPGDSTAQGHYHFARLPGMWDRTITLSSAGKTFSATGWQIGWMIGPEHFMRPVHDLIPCVQFCANTPAQHALCSALETANMPFEGEVDFYAWLRLQFMSKRAVLEEGLRAAGLTPIPSNGGYFLMAKLPNHHPLVPQPQPRQQGDNCYEEEEEEEPYDWRYCRMLAHEYGVIGIPTSSFFSQERYLAAAGADSGEKSGERNWYARFALCKKDKTIVEAAKRLKDNAHKGTAQGHD